MMPLLLIMTSHLTTTFRSLEFALCPIIMAPGVASAHCERIMNDRLVSNLYIINFALPKLMYCRLRCLVKCHRVYGPSSEN